MKLLPVGHTVAGYRIETVLGVGGMSVVYQARHPRLPRSDALKVLSAATLQDDPSARTRFQGEADRVAGLDHPNIVRIFDSGIDGDLLWVSMQLIPGSDASKLLREYPEGLPPAMVTDLVGAIADALDYSHSRGIQHRDIKPGNIFVDRSTMNYRYSLGDFGIARTESDPHLTKTGSLFGTVDYCAPEHLAGSESGPAADQYSLAATAVHLLSGQRPYGEASAATIMHRHISASPPQPTLLRADLSPAVDPVIARAMAKEPADRYPTCRAFARALADAVRTPAPVPAVTPPERRMIPRLRRPLEAAAAPIAATRRHTAESALPAAPPAAADTDAAGGAQQRKTRRRAVTLALCAAAVVAVVTTVLAVSGDDGDSPALADSDDSAVTTATPTTPRPTTATTPGSSAARSPQRQKFGATAPADPQAPPLRDTDPGGAAPIAPAPAVDPGGAPSLGTADSDLSPPPLDDSADWPGGATDAPGQSVTRPTEAGTADGARHAPRTPTRSLYIDDGRIDPCLLPADILAEIGLGTPVRGSAPGPILDCYTRVLDDTDATVEFVFYPLDAEGPAATASRTAYRHAAELTDGWRAYRTSVVNRDGSKYVYCNLSRTIPEVGLFEIYTFGGFEDDIAPEEPMCRRLPEIAEALTEVVAAL